MKKLFIAILFACIGYSSANADGKVIVITAKESNQDGHQPPRSPIRIPSVYIDGNILTFDASCIGCTISLVQDDEVIYTATVVETDDWEGEVVLPEYLTGVFELQLQIGAITFVGEIEL